MRLLIKDRQLHSESYIFEIEKYPKKCPMCHTSIALKPYLDTANVVNENNDYRNASDNHNVQAIFRCPECFNLFIATYNRIYGRGDKFWLSYNEPLYTEKINIPKELLDLSPNYAEIYQQANVAESKKLTDIAGCGYRKALEFLIKDYCIKFLQKDHDSIAKKFLGSCIEEDINDTTIKNSAKRATWLGNDESHYIKKWEKHDISNLKELIQITQTAIMTQILAKKYNDEMN